MEAGRPINAVIGVRRSGGSTFYVRRSMEMANYPGVWSLLSIQFRPGELTGPKDLGEAQKLFGRMSEERLGGVPLIVRSHLTSGSSDQNPMGVDVTLHLYEIELPEEPRLDPRYYTDAAWLSPEQYEERCAEQLCGLCLRLWSDYAWAKGWTDRPFLPHVTPRPPAVAA